MSVLSRTIYILYNYLVLCVPVTTRTFRALRLPVSPFTAESLLTQFSGCETGPPTLQTEPTKRCDLSPERYTSRTQLTHSMRRFNDYRWCTCTFLYINHRYFEKKCIICNYIDYFKFIDWKKCVATRLYLSVIEADNLNIKTLT